VNSLQAHADDVGQLYAPGDFASLHFGLRYPLFLRQDSVTADWIHRDHWVVPDSLSAWSRNRLLHWSFLQRYCPGERQSHRKVAAALSLSASGYRISCGYGVESVFNMLEDW